MAKIQFFFLHLYNIRLGMVATGTSMVRKLYNFQKNVIWTSGYHLTIPWKGYHNLYFLKIWQSYFVMIHQHIYV